MTVNVHEAKARLSELLDLMARGETVIICRRNQPIAELRPYSGGGEKRPIGLCSELAPLSSEFFEPLPNEWIDAFS